MDERPSPCAGRPRDQRAAAGSCTGCATRRSLYRSSWPAVGGPTALPPARRPHGRARTRWCGTALVGCPGRDGERRARPQPTRCTPRPSATITPSRTCRGRCTWRATRSRRSPSNVLLAARASRPPWRAGSRGGAGRGALGAPRRPARPHRPARRPRRRADRPGGRRSQRPARSSPWPAPARAALPRRCRAHGQVQRPGHQRQHPAEPVRRPRPAREDVRAHRQGRRGPRPGGEPARSPSGCAPTRSSRWSSAPTRATASRSPSPTTPPAATTASTSTACPSDRLVG